MRIRCPFCGERERAEFTYLGDANARRPNLQAADNTMQFVDAVYLRDNPAGPHEELWYHLSGCRSWLRVIRNTRTHEIATVKFAKVTAT
jgi:methylglutamate dehydrogenase subunit B